MRLVLALIFVVGLLFLGCTSPVVCNKPYIQVGTECCLDTNDNNICDKDESGTNVSQPPKTTTCIGGANDYCRDNVRYYDASCENGVWTYKTMTCAVGCSDGKCTCPSSCDDGDPCTEDSCNADTGTCVYEKLNISACDESQYEYVPPDEITIPYDSYTACDRLCCILYSGDWDSTYEYCDIEYGSSGYDSYINCYSSCWDGDSSSSTSQPTQPTQPKQEPELSISIAGCDTSNDIIHGLYEVTNVYVWVNNTGDATATNIDLEASATDEDGVHPNKYATIPSLPASQGTVMKLTVDTSYKDYGTITVVAQGDNTNYATTSTNMCAQIDPQLVSTVGQLVKLYLGGGFG